MIIAIEIAVLDAVIDKDPHAVDILLAETFPRARLSLASAGKHGATYDGTGNQLTPHTHYVWGDSRLADPDSTEAISVAVDKIAKGRRRQRPNADADQATRDTAVNAARQRVTTAIGDRAARKAARQARVDRSRPGRGSDGNDDDGARFDLEVAEANAAGHRGVALLRALP